MAASSPPIAARRVPDPPQSRRLRSRAPQEPCMRGNGRAGASFLRPVRASSPSAKETLHCSSSLRKCAWRKYNQTNPSRGIARWWLARHISAIRRASRQTIAGARLAVAPARPRAILSVFHETPRSAAAGTASSALGVWQLSAEGFRRLDAEFLSGMRRLVASFARNEATAGEGRSKLSSHAASGPMSRGRARAAGASPAATPPRGRRRRPRCCR